MTEKKPAARKEIGDVAMGYDDDAGNAGVVRTRSVTFDQPGQELALEGGGTLAPFTLAYETYGTLSAAQGQRRPRLPRALGRRPRGGLHSANDKRPGWWDMMIGPGKGIDTDKYFVICANVLGGCSGTHRARLGSTPRPASPTAPTSRSSPSADMVHAQMRAARPPRHRQAAGRRRRLDGRHAGARVGDLATRTASHLCDAARHRGAPAAQASPSTRSAARRSWPTPTGTAATTTAASRRRRA